MAAHINVEITHVACPTCGLSYALSENYHRSRSKDGRETYCPNGHKWWYIVESEKTREELIEDNKELQQRAFQAEHRIEQLEAKVRDLQADVVKPSALEPESTAEMQMQDLMEHLGDDERRPYLCTGCGRQYRSEQWLRRHITEKHGVKEEVEQHVETP